MPIDKIVSSFDEAVSDIEDGATLLLGGFGTIASIPTCLIEAVYRKGVKNLTAVSNLSGVGAEVWKLQGALFPEDMDILVRNERIKKAIVSAPVSAYYINSFEKMLRAGKVELEMVPQGTLADRIRAAKAGLGGFYGPVGVGTVVEEGKEKRVIDGREYLLEMPIKADFALIHAHKGDRWGNLVYNGTSRAFNPTMAGAAKITIAEVDEFVELGELDPEHIITPGIYVDRVVQRPKVYDGDMTQTTNEQALESFKRFQEDVKKVTGKNGHSKNESLLQRERLDRHVMALRAAKEFEDGFCVNLGLGIPMMASNFVPAEREVIFHSENGVMGYGEITLPGEGSLDLVNAGGQTVHPKPGMVVFSSDEAFTIVRGGHLDVTVMGAYQVSEKGDLANYMIPEREVGIIGGAMDLAVGVKRCIILMNHVTKTGEFRIVKKLSYLPTAINCVDLIITDIAVIEVTDNGLVLKECAPGWTPEEVQQLTEPTLIIDPNCSEMTLM